jgi:hypothetical protein
MNPYGKRKNKMSTGTKVAAAASAALVGALMVAGCAADEDTRCDSYTAVAFSPRPAPAPRPAAPAPRPAPAPKPVKPKSPGGTTVVPVPVNPGTHVVCTGE